MKIFLSAVLLLDLVSAYATEKPLALKQITVTATRTPKIIDNSLAAVTVITRADIELKQALSLKDILRSVPGISITNTGGLGKATSIFMRGTNSDHVLVLINGLRVESASLGTVAFEHIPIEQIERIEIVRGPRSSLYGSDAIGGVIQIFTRKGEKDITPYFNVSSGSHGTYKLSGGISGNIKKGWYSLDASRLESDGFNSCKGSGGGCYVDEPDKDGYRSNASNIRAGYNFNKNLAIEGHFMHNEGDVDYDGSFSNQSDTVQQVIGGKLNYNPIDLLNLTLTGGRSRDQSKNKGATNKNYYNTNRYSVSLQNDSYLDNNNLFSFGLDYYKDELNSSTDFSKTSRYNIAGFIQYQLDLDDFDFVAGVRRGEDQQFGEYWTGNVELGYVLIKKYLHLMTSFGTGFKSPNFNDLYWPKGKYYSGNENLNPEESQTWEIGVSGEIAQLNWSINGFHTMINGLISYDSSCFCSNNIEKARILGLETSIYAKIYGFDIAANFILLNPENLSKTNKHKILNRRAEQIFHLDLDRKFKQFYAGLTVHGEGRRFEDLANNKRLSGHVLLDLRTGIDFYQNFTLSGRVSNLLDKNYTTVDFYNNDGRNFLLTLSYRY